MPDRRALSLVETLVVLAILAILFGLLLPAVQSARERAREAVCKNNLYQLSVAVSNYAEAHKRLPPENPPDKVGGWSIEILPFLEKSNLKESVPADATIADALEFLWRPPGLFVCPVHIAVDEPQLGVVQPAHYALVIRQDMRTRSVIDVPLEISTPWAAGPEIDEATLRRLTGPHHGRYFRANNTGTSRRGVFVWPRN